MTVRGSGTGPPSYTGHSSPAKDRSLQQGEAGLDSITALRAPAIKALREGGALQMSLFDDCDMAGVTSPEFPGERLIVCRNRARP
jgi:hypothetical protein